MSGASRAPSTAAARPAPVRSGLFERASLLECLVLAGLAAAYFALASPLGIETVDEGQIVYPSWAVAEGAVPYRDFRHLYGPSLFLLNGYAMRWLGADLMTIRCVLVAVKSVAAVAVYLLSSKVAARPFALLAWATFVAVWGTPLTFNIPYANHYASTLVAVGLLLYLSCRRFETGCVLAGLCFGAAATFKQTSGPFACIAFLSFLVLRPRPPDARARIADRLPDWLARLAVAGLGVAALGLFAAYLRARNEAWTFLVLFSAPAVVAAAVLVSASGGGPASMVRRRSAVWGMLCASAGAAVFPSLMIGTYVAKGLLPDLVFNLARGLPEVPQWFVPYPFPDRRAVLALATFAATIGAIASRRRRSRPVITVGLAVAATAAGVLWLREAAESGLSGYTGSRRWWGDVARLWLAFPFVVVWWSGFELFRERRRAETEPVPRKTALLLLGCHGAVSLLYLYPAGDVFHVVMALPSFLPLAAHLAGRFCGEGGPIVRRTAFALTAGAAALLSGPSVQWLLESRQQAGEGVLQRASGISDAEPRFSELVELASRIERGPGARPEMLVTTGEQMLYFLAGGRSVMERDEFVLYLIALDLVTTEDARRLVDEAAVVERMAVLHPMIVDHSRNRAAERFRRTFERIAAYIDAHYRPAATVGGYRVLEWAG